MSIKMLVEAALRVHNPRPCTRENLTIIHHEIVRLEKTVQGLLDFTRPPALQRSVRDLREVVDAALALVRTRARQQNVQIDSAFPEQAVAGHVRIGWDSPVSEVVNPGFIELNGRAGLGWLEGFNEMVTRCGYAWVGHPGMDKGAPLSLHGLASNIPASKVVLSISQQPPYTIKLKGELKEQAFKLVNFIIATELSTEAGAQHFSLHDTLTNNGDYSNEYQALYHCNFGPPLLDMGARFSAPVQQVSPFNDKAAGELSDWQTYREPTRDYDETVYNVIPYGDENGQTLAVLHNAAGELGISLGFNIQQLPVFSLWKNTDTVGQGYVTGLEPGTSWSYNRSYQRALNRVPTIGAKEQRHFDITYTFLADKTAVDNSLQQVQKIQHQRPTEVRKSPLVDLPKG